ncbi:MAG TPA: hypothetical protein PKX05_05325, partial [bacterium]|nr:hypothetical protein [bacterium]
QRLDFPPGITITARIVINRILNRIISLKNICYLDDASDKWQCPKAKKNYYQKARKMQISFIMQHCGEIKKSEKINNALKKGIKVIIPPRSIDDIKKHKEKSIAAIQKEKHKGIRIRPHMLMCAVCQYGTNTKPGEVYDNLPEFIDIITKEPETMVKMAEGAEWMMCAPCPSWHNNMCTHLYGSGGLSNQLRDIRLLQKLGLCYGSTIKAKNLYSLVYEKVLSTLEICRFDNPYPSVWYSGCGQRKTGNPAYKKGIKKLINKFKK